jgi:hypothetical protein
MAWSGEHRAFIVEKFIKKNGGSPVYRVDAAFAGFDHLRFLFLWGYLKAKVYEQRPLTLEALK